MSAQMDSEASANDSLRRSYSMPTTPTVSSRDIQSAQQSTDPKISTSSTSLAIAPVRTAKSEDVTTTHVKSPPESGTASTPHHKLDRYGFILNMDSRGNIGSSESEMVDAHDAHDTAPPNGAAPSSHTTTPIDTPKVAEVERNARRVVKWDSMMSKWDAVSVRRRALIKKRLRKGLPDTVRATVWPLLCHVDERIQQYPHLYRELVEQSVGVPSTTNTSTTSSNTATISATTATIAPLPTPRKNGSPKRQKETIPRTTGLTAVEQVAAEAAARVAAEAQAALRPTAPPVQFHHSKSFKNIQETIERDIHRTFPRHSLFYSNGNDDEEVEAKTNAMFDEDSVSVSSSDLAQGICGTTEISSMIRELELTPHSAPVTAKSPAKAQSDDSHWIHTGNANGDRINQLKILEDAGGQSRLRRVLKAYSTYDREIGYCQGMNFIAAMFLTLVTEEKAFWMLVAVMNDKPCRMRGLFGEGMRETHQVLYVSEKLIHQFLPRLAKHLDKETIHVTMFATQWILTQYTSSFRFELVTRLWDCFLFEGWKITYRVMLSLLQHSQAVLLTRSFEDILAYFRELPERPDINGKIVDEAIKIPLRTSHILKHEKDFLAQQKRQN